MSYKTKIKSINNIAKDNAENNNSKKIDNNKSKKILFDSDEFEEVDFIEHKTYQFRPGNYVEVIMEGDG